MQLHMVEREKETCSKAGTCKTPRHALQQSLIKMAAGLQKGDAELVLCQPTGLITTVDSSKPEKRKGISKFCPVKYLQMK